MKLFEKLLIVSYGLLLASTSSAQVKLHSNTASEASYSKNDIGFEVGGNCLFYSAYYQRTLYRKGNTQFNIRIGGSYVPGQNNNNDHSSSHEFNLVGYVFPNVLFFKKRHAWEIGIGVNLFANFQKGTFSYYNNPIKDSYTNNTQLYFLTPQLGYRLYFKNSKFYFRAAISTFLYAFGHETDNQYVNVKPKVLPWGAMGFGFTF